MAQPDYGLLNTNMPAEAALAPVKGMGAVNALQSQVLQNEAGRFELQNALAEQEAYKQAAQTGNIQQSLLERGLGKQALAAGKMQAETQKAGTEGRLKQLELERERFADLRFNPSDNNILAHLEDAVKRGDTTPQKAMGVYQQVAGMNEQQRIQYFTEMGAKADTIYKHMTLSAHDKAQLAISQGHLNLARERLSQEMAGGTLTPETVDMAANLYLKTGQLPPLGMGKQAAAARQAILNRATVLGTTPGADGQPAPSAADVANTVKDAKQLIAGERSFINKNGNVVRSQNVLVDHLDTLDDAAKALANNDVRAFNALGNKVAKATGATAPTDFEGVKKIVGDELVKAIQGGAGAVFDRKEIQESLSAANSPAQLASVVNRYKQLAKGQLQGLEKQYESQSGKKDFKERFLTEAAKKQLSGATSPNIPQGAIDALKSGKGTREQFDQIFGAGAADRVLGKGK